MRVTCMIACVAIAGCATSNYTPAASDELRVIDGGMNLRRGDRTEPNKPEGLVKLTRDVPAAHAYAVEAEEAGDVANILGLTGSGLMVVGAITFAAAESDTEEGLSAVGLVSAVALGVAIVLQTTAVFYAHESSVRSLDAFNAFNDARRDAPRDQPPTVMRAPDLLAPTR